MIVSIFIDLDKGVQFGGSIKAFETKLMLGTRGENGTKSTIKSRMDRKSE